MSEGRALEPTQAGRDGERREREGRRGNRPQMEAGIVVEVQMEAGIVSGVEVEAGIVNKIRTGRYGERGRRRRPGKQMGQGCLDSEQAEVE